MSNFDYMEFGTAPVEETCAQTTDPDYNIKAKAECRKYIELLRKIFGDEPEGAQLMIKGSEHDFGRYYEVACKFDIEKPEAVDYVYAIEANMPLKWIES